MNHSIEFSSVREQLVRQLILLGDEKNRFLDAYFVMEGKERQEIKLFLTKYKELVEKILAMGDEHLLTHVLIGSHVTIEYPEFRTTDSFTIVMPSEADPDENLISFLSPVGKKLLMEPIGEIVSVAAPSGEIQFCIKEIQYPAGNATPEGGTPIES